MRFENARERDYDTRAPTRLHAGNQKPTCTLAHLPYSSRALLVLSLTLAAVPCASANAQAAPPQSAESKALRTSVEQRLVKELLAQRAVWQADEKKSHHESVEIEPGTQRVAMLNCHTDRRFTVGKRREMVRAPGGGAEYSRAVDDPYPLPTMITSRMPTVSLFHRVSICPNWIPVPARKAAKEHEYSGRSLEPVVTLPFTRELIDALIASVKQFPSDDWFIGQLTRVLVENRDLARAQQFLEGCQATAAWCAALGGYTAYTADQLRAADSLFRLSLSLEESQRCHWTDIGLLLPDLDRARYQSLGCEVRAMLDPIMWWLANPLLSEAANRRLLEHYSRRVRNQLVNELPLDAHNNLAPMYASADAIAEMRTRYGWPDHLRWWSAAEDGDHWRYLSGTTKNPPPFSAAEYSRDNQSTFAPLAFVTSPLKVTDSAYQLRRADKETAEKWWPSEFFRHPDGVIVEMRDRQRATFRRDTSALLFMAASVAGGALDSIGTAPVTSYLMASRTLDEIQFLDSAASTQGSNVVLSSEIKWPALIGMEHSIHANGVAGARTRFGIDSVPTLRNLPARCALSDPVLLDADAVTGNGVDDVKRGMLGSTALHKRDRVGIAWESYGVQAGDTATIGVNIVNVTELGRLRQVGVAIGVVSDPRSAVGVRWTEPSQRRTRVTVTSPMPVLHYQLTVDLGQLAAGNYLLEVTTESASCGLVKSQRTLSITK